MLRSKTSSSYPKHLCLQDKFSPQLEIVSSDPGRFLAWLVLLSTLLTLLLGHIVYLSVFFLLYITWAYTDHIDREASSKDINQDSDENEWLLDKFMCFLQQLDNGKLRKSKNSKNVITTSIIFCRII